VSLYALTTYTLAKKNSKHTLYHSLALLLGSLFSWLGDRGTVCHSLYMSAYVNIRRHIFFSFFFSKKVCHSLHMSAYVHILRHDTLYVSTYTQHMCAYVSTYARNHILIPCMCPVLTHMLISFRERAHKRAHNQCLLCGKRPATYGIPCTSLTHISIPFMCSILTHMSLS